MTREFSYSLEAGGRAAESVPSEPKLLVERLSVSYDGVAALRSVNLSIYPNEVLALTGPGGSGKTTLLRTINRLNDRIRSARVTEGRVLLDGEDVYGPDVDAYAIRQRMAMVFALPTPLPKSIFDNVAYGPRVAGIRKMARLREIVERALRDAILWDEVSSRLGDPAMTLSGGQQQRLCIARALAQQPEVLLLDEPCSGLDPISTLKIEDALRKLKEQYTIVLVSHNTQQAARVADRIAFLLMGELVEHGRADQVVTSPADTRTADYFQGRFG
ncbi:MAG TPA: phosphate ABC transporter ATP-binding protein [Armatimonadota bacterium]|nr:phosphate ABC transporter ATP-binding protein [Armatimonadota bacterium]HQK92835.1 phosphate ABC transporter ATP-binding protein [Armatimonadota bacterium]